MRTQKIVFQISNQGIDKFYITNILVRGSIEPDALSTIAWEDR